MSFCWRHPSLLAIEVGWRWLVGAPFLLACWAQAQRIVARLPPESVGLDRVNFQNPWTSSVLLADAAGSYQPAVAAALRYGLPTAVLGWAMVSALGRTLLLWRMSALDALGDSRSSLSAAMRRMPAMILLQGLWMLALLCCWWVWYRGVAWAAATHITSAAEPDLVGYLCWLIFLSLGIFTLWAMASWVLAIAPALLFYQASNAFSALGGSFRLGRVLSGKLMEVNLVMAIVKIALIVLAMVFSAAPLPFSDTFGPEFMHVLYVAIAIGFLIANDYFHVVRLKSFVELWRHYRDLPAEQSLEFASSELVKAYGPLEADFKKEILQVPWAFISDESSLWDFTTENSLELYYAKILQVYRVDVSDIEGALLWKIFQRIAQRP